MLASGSVHLGLFALLGGFTLGFKPTSQPVLIDLVEAQSTMVSPVRSLPLKKFAIVKLPMPEEVLPEDIVTPSEKIPVAVSATPSQIASAKNVYISKLFQTLNAKKRYPEISLKMRQQGRLKVRFLLERDGRVASAELVETSSFTPLNEAAKSLLAEIKKFDPIPSEISDQQWAVTVPIEYLM